MQAEDGSGGTEGFACPRKNDRNTNLRFATPPHRGGARVRGAERRGAPPAADRGHGRRRPPFFVGHQLQVEPLFSPPRGLGLLVPHPRAPPLPLPSPTPNLFPPHPRRCFSSGCWEEGSPSSPPCLILLTLKGKWPVCPPSIDPPRTVNWRVLGHCVICVIPSPKIISAHQSHTSPLNHLSKVSPRSPAHAVQPIDGKLQPSQPLPPAAGGGVGPTGSGGSQQGSTPPAPLKMGAGFPACSRGSVPGASRSTPPFLRG